MFRLLQFFIFFFVVIPFVLASGPAKVSTACDDLKEGLNTIRLANPLSVEVDERVTILEKSLTNINRGQGIGFKVFDFVIDIKVAPSFLLISRSRPLFLLISRSLKGPSFLFSFFFPLFLHVFNDNHARN
eukprot:SAG11_NODE_2507_length_3273_cov_3.855072_3_plen_130_part_00